MSDVWHIEKMHLKWSIQNDSLWIFEGRKILSKKKIKYLNKAGLECDN